MELTQYLDLNVKLFEMISTDGGSKKTYIREKLRKFLRG